MIDFPASPVNGQSVTLNGTKYTWNSAKGTWQTSSTLDYVNPSAFYYNSRNITADKTILSTENAMSVGPITITDGVTVTIEDGGEWTIV